jgi:hypothetical protein
MTGLTISAPEWIALVLKKLITPGVPDPEYKFIDKLPAEYRGLVFKILGEGKDKAAREARLRAELLKDNKLEDLERLNRADAMIDLDQVQLEDSWKFFSLEEAYKPLPALEWVVDGFIARPSITIFFGAPKMLKSLFVQDLVTCTASGSNWLPGLPGKCNHKGYPTNPTPALWLDFENGARRMKERFSAFGRALKLPADTKIWCTSMPLPWLDASRLEQIGDLMQRIQNYQAGLVVIDHLTQIVGVVDENSSLMARIVGNLRSMVEELNLSLILLHHQIKGATRMGVMSSESLRGHGSILASCDLACLIERNENNRDQVLIKPVAVRGSVVDSFSAIFTYKQKDDGSQDLEEARFWGIEAEKLEDQAEAAVIDILTGESDLTHTALITALTDAIANLGNFKARRVINRLERERTIKFKPGAKGAKKYYLPKDEE